MAAQPRHRADRARRHRRRRAGARRQQRDRCRSSQSIKDALPYGYRIETGGSIEESAKANAALVAVFPVMALVMLALLMIQLQSFSRLALGVRDGAARADRRDRRAADRPTSRSASSRCSASSRSPA